jgi:hypothetical protein
MILLGDVAQVVLVLIHSEIVLIFMQDRCTVFAEHTIGTKISVDTHDRTPW